MLSQSQECKFAFYQWPTLQYSPGGKLPNRPILFRIPCLVSWLLNESEAGVGLDLIETCQLFNDAVVMQISKKLHKKSSEVSVKTRSTPVSLSFKGQATKHTTVKWSIVNQHIIFIFKKE